MATFLLENVPDDLYEALQRQARQHRRSIAQEILAAVEQSVAAERKSKAHRDLLRLLKRYQSRRSRDPVPSPWTDEM